MRPFALALCLALACAAPQSRPAVDSSAASSAASNAAEPDLHALYSQDPALWPAPTLSVGVEHRELGLLAVPVRDASPAARAKEDLGQLLFFDARLSGTGQMACASCHDAELGFGDGRAMSFGHGGLALARNAPSLWNTALRTSWFWDGRASSLEDQAALVIGNAQEMHGSVESAVAIVASSRGYRARFAEAYGDEQVTAERLLGALAAFERTLISDRSSAFDRFLSGERDALGDAELRGLHLFRTKARCLNCHSGPLLTDERFHNLGLTYYGRELEDLGRYRVTKDPADVGAFRTPSLRNLGRTGPYMHNGLFELEGVIHMYSAGMPRIEPSEAQKDDPLFPRKSPLVERLDLDAQEKGDLAAFLRSLTERKRRIRAPELPSLGEA